MNQILVRTRPYSGKTRWVLDSLKGFGLKKPNAVLIEVELDKTTQIAKVLINGNLYKEASFGEMKDVATTSKIRYSNALELAQVLGAGLLEAGFPVKIHRKVYDFAKSVSNEDFDDE